MPHISPLALRSCNKPGLLYDRCPFFSHISSLAGLVHHSLHHQSSQSGFSYSASTVRRVFITSYIFWDISVKVITSRRDISPPSSESKNKFRLLPASAGLLLDWLLDPQDGGDIYLWNLDFQRTTPRYILKYHLLWKPQIQHIFKQSLNHPCLVHSDHILESLLLISVTK
jgi:hypothetical protein